MDIGYVIGYENDVCAPRLTGRLDASSIPVKIKKFEDGEIKTIVGFNSRIIEGENMVMIGSYDITDENVIMVARNTRPPKSPDEHMMNNFRVLGTLKRQKPNRIILLAPYMHYARQDKEFLEGESWSLKDVAELYETRGITDLITINPHHTDLQSFFDPELVTVHDLGPEKLFADYLKTNDLVGENPVIVGPDEGSIKMIKSLAECFEEGEYVCIAQKRDHHAGDKEVLDVPTDISKVKGRPVVVYDDLTWSGGTLLRGEEALKSHEPESVYAAVAHLVSQNAAKKLVEMGIDGVLYTNSLIKHEETAWFKSFGHRLHEIDTVPLVADYIKKL